MSGIFSKVSVTSATILDHNMNEFCLILCDTYCFKDCLNMQEPYKEIEEDYLNRYSLFALRIYIYPKGGS